MFRKRSELFDANFVYFILIVLFVGIRIISSTFSISGVVGYGLNLVIQVGLMLCLPLFLFSVLRKQKIKTTLNQYGFKKINAKSIIYSIIIGILIYGLTVCISAFFNLILTYLGYDPTYGATSGSAGEYSVGMFILQIIFTAILPGICEEVAHRGMLVSAYKPLGLKKAVLLSGLFFGLMHLNIEQFFYATLIGFLFGFVSIITDSIFPTMIMHFINNFISVYLGFASSNGYFLGDLFTNVQAWLNNTNPFAAFFAILLVIVIMLALLFMFVMLLIKETRIRRLAQVADSVVKDKLRQELFEGTDLQTNNQIQNPDIVVQNASNDITKKVYNINFANSFAFANKQYKPTFKDKIFFYGSLALGIVVTVFTFIWGII